MGLDQKLKEFKQLYDLKGCYNVAGTSMLKRTTTPLIWLQDIYPAVSDMACIDFLDYLESSDAEAYRFERLKLDLMLAYEIFKRGKGIEKEVWRSLSKNSLDDEDFAEALNYCIELIQYRGFTGKGRIVECSGRHVSKRVHYNFSGRESNRVSCFTYYFSGSGVASDSCYLVKVYQFIDSLLSYKPTDYKTLPIRWHDVKYSSYTIHEKDCEEFISTFSRYFPNSRVDPRSTFERIFKLRTEKDKTAIYKNLNTQPSLVENILSNPGTWDDSFREVAKRHIRLYIQNGGFVCEASWNAIVKQLDLPTFTRIPEDGKICDGNVLDGSDPLQRKMLRRKIKSNAREFMQCPVIKTPLLKLSLLSERRKSLAPY